MFLMFSIQVHIRLFIDNFNTYIVRIFFFISRCEMFGVAYLFDGTMTISIKSYCWSYILSLSSLNY